MKLPDVARFVSRSPLSGLKRGDWRRRPIPEACRGIPTMLMADELRLLNYLADRYWQGDGIIVDGGCFLGGSTVALASGLRTSMARRRRVETPLIHSYDLFSVEEYALEQFFSPTARVGDSFRDSFEQNTAAYAPLLRVFEGDISASDPPDAPIEVLFIDLAKDWPVCDWITENLFPRLIPGHSIVIQQDYLWEEWTGWLQVTMEYYADQFEILGDTGRNSVVFRLAKPFPPGQPGPGLVASLSLAEKSALMERAAARFPQQQAAVLRASARHFLAILGND
jgi:hypothetical protein